jgi:hypothetical protein
VSKSAFSARITSKYPPPHTHTPTHAQTPDNSINSSNDNNYSSNDNNYSSNDNINDDGHHHSDQTTSNQPTITMDLERESS